MSQICQREAEEMKIHTATDPEEIPFPAVTPRRAMPALQVTVLCNPRMNISPFSPSPQCHEAPHAE